ncbi:MAG: hypothetical protein Q9161_004532 [Pseudevernia consocians]
MKKAALQLGHVNSYGEALLKDLNDRELELINQKREGITAMFKEAEKDREAREGKISSISESIEASEDEGGAGGRSLALNLLLTALNCQSLSEQKQLLEASQSRRILDQVKDDSSSLIVLRDSTSFSSSWAMSTERSSVLNRVFDFDGEVMESKVYRNHMRYLIRRVFRKRNVQDRWPRDRNAANPFTITIHQGSDTKMFWGLRSPERRNSNAIEQDNEHMGWKFLDVCTTKTSRMAKWLNESNAHSIWLQHLHVSCLTPAVTVPDLQQLDERAFERARPSVKDTKSSPAQPSPAQRGTSF